MQSRLPRRIAMNEASRIGPRSTGVSGARAYRRIANSAANRKKPVSMNSPYWKRLRDILIVHYQLPIANWPFCEVVSQNRWSNRQLANDNRRSSELPRVPLDEVHPKQQREDRAKPEKDPEGQQHLHVSFAPPRHQHDTDDRTSQHASKDRQDGESPAEISADHKHHLHVAESHRFDAAQLLPRPTHQPKRAAADQRADCRARKRCKPDRHSRERAVRKRRQIVEVQTPRQQRNRNAG